MALNAYQNQPELLGQYLALAKRLAGEKIKEPDLTVAIRSLPTLSFEQLDNLAEFSQTQAHLNPKLGFALAKVGEVSAVIHHNDALLQAKAAWYLGRAANNFYRPHLAADPLKRAKNKFKELNETAWVAACDWQLNALPWARPNLQDCLTTVAFALEVFTDPSCSLGFFRFECQFTLAYIQTIIGFFDESQRNLEVCESYFQAQEDEINLIRCKRLRGNIFQRQSKFEEAIVELETSLILAQAVNAPVEAALAMNQLGGIFYRRQRVSGSYREAEATLLKATNQLRALDLFFWEAICQADLASIYISRGHFSEALASITYAQNIYENYNAVAPLAGSLVDAGWLETYRANYEQGLDHFGKAESLLQKMGNSYLLGMCYMHLGELYLEMGRYQLALYYLEEASDGFLSLNSSGRIAECGLRLARCWNALGLPEQALDALDRVEKKATEAKRGNIFSYLHLRRAETFFIKEERARAVNALREAVIAAQEFEDQTGIALSRRVLGETLVGMGELVEGAENLEAAEKTFSKLEIIVEQAACKVAWGNYYRKIGKNDEAHSVWQQAVQMLQNIAPDIFWQAQAGLAGLAEEAGNIGEALTHYRKVVSALNRLREDMWQPTLAGNFLNRPIKALEKAIYLAVEANASEETLSFIEASKAQVLANQFKQPVSTGNEIHSQELSNLVADIRWREELLRGKGSGENQFGISDLLQMRSELRDMVRKYDRLRSRIERKHKSSDPSVLPKNISFALELFRNAANNEFDKDWMALDYYLMVDKGICLMVSNDSCRVIELGHPGPARWSLDQPPALGAWQDKDLTRIGKWLLPNEVLEKMSEDKVVIIAPHRQLNHLPWSALSAGGKPLINCSIPVIVPSLDGMMALMKRSFNPSRSSKGLLLAVSKFEERHLPLPFVNSEIETLKSMYPISEPLLDEGANWAAFQAIADKSGLDSYAFLHIASHAFADTISGRLSGIALYDRDVWLDELRACAPFPALVTLSACSGSKGRFFEGDEQIGLATTFLAAGARQVVASLWPIKDNEVMMLMKLFYKNLLSGYPVAYSLALAQRTAVQNNKAVADWAGFRCTGLPK